MAISLDTMSATDSANATISRPDGDFAPALPPEHRLEMPVQSLRRWTQAQERKPVAARNSLWVWLARLFVFGGGLGLTGYGAWEMYQVVSVSRTTVLQWVLLVLFAINFSWIAVSFTSAIVGFVAGLVSLPQRRREITNPASLIPATLRERTAIVMPIYNESPSRVFAATAAIRESVEATGLGKHFDYFILSDTTNPDVWVAEERTFLTMQQELGPDCRVYYRHRTRNTHRKAGNIADFVTRWGGAYEHMVVLDADSLMTGEAVVRLTSTMENDPDAGIIQSLPIIINRNTLFARIQQFAGRIYGPLIARGLALWSGRDGNYWGHNAIIRTAAFAAHCGMPTLKGKPPFGGLILSHDFVEAALIRRAGWSVYMLPDLAGSYEESPPSLIDVAARDRRWCQGNLQHIRVIGSNGLKMATRQHFATGIMSYMSSPFWLLQLFVGILLVLQTHYARPEYFSQEFSLFPIWPRFDSERALALFALTMGILLAPKLLGLILTLLNSNERRASGGGILLTLSTLFEVLLSALLAPIMMVIQSGAVAQILMGRDTGWQPQRRDDGSIPMRDIIRRHRWHVLLGVVAGVSAFMIAPSLFAWMSPTIIGLVLAIPISWASGDLGLGLAFKRAGLLLMPEETRPPSIAVRANELSASYAEAGYDEEDALKVLHRDTLVQRYHDHLLPHAGPRRKGDISTEHALAQAKLLDAETLDDALTWLNNKERSATLGDRALLNLAIRLPDTKDSQRAAE